MREPKVVKWTPDDAIDKSKRFSPQRLFWMIKNKEGNFVFPDNTTAFASIFKKKADCQKFCLEGEEPYLVTLRIQEAKP